MSAFQKFRDGSKQRHSANGLFFAAVGALVLWASLLGGVIYVAIHFIRKYW